MRNVWAACLMLLVCVAFFLFLPIRDYFIYGKNWLEYSFKSKIDIVIIIFISFSAILYILCILCVRIIKPRKGRKVR